MIFKDIKSGYPVYMLDRGKMEAVAGKVVGVSGPRYMQMQGIQQTQIVVDITVETEGVSRQYAIPESLSVTYAGDLVLSTDRDGQKREGAHWTKEQVTDATNGMKFREGVTDWDKYVAFNAGYADFCRVLTDELVLRASHAFYFADEDAPENKVWIYMRCMQQR